MHSSQYYEGALTQLSPTATASTASGLYYERVMIVMTVACIINVYYPLSSVALNLAKGVNYDHKVRCKLKHV
jgi:hypothetical protein